MEIGDVLFVFVAHNVVKIEGESGQWRHLIPILSFPFLSIFSLGFKTGRCGNDREIGDRKKSCGGNAAAEEYLKLFCITVVCGGPSDIPRIYCAKRKVVCRV